MRNKVDFTWRNLRLSRWWGWLGLRKASRYEIPRMHPVNAELGKSVKWLRSVVSQQKNRELRWFLFGSNLLSASPPGLHIAYNYAAIVEWSGESPSICYSCTTYRDKAIRTSFFCFCTPGIFLLLVARRHSYADQRWALAELNVGTLGKLLWACIVLGEPEMEEIITTSHFVTHSGTSPQSNSYIL